MKEWPSIRQSPRFRLDAAINVVSRNHGSLRGWCHDISQGGMSGNVSSVLTVGDEVTLEFQFPNSTHRHSTAARVCYGRGFRYGFVFLNPEPALQTRISEFGLHKQTAAFILSANAPMVWIVHRMLQQLGVSQVFTGGPKDFPLLTPHLIVIDSDWPDFEEVLAFLRSESAGTTTAIVAVLSPTCHAANAHRAGADLVLHKPLALDRTRKLLELAFRLITKPAASEGNPEIATAMKFLNPTNSTRNSR
ncbi:MAG TPA: PilZ domain-containing protein [Terriglobales bacterium]|nr:PilZ domain-containing protein [Terriglobales bacterium]